MGKHAKRRFSIRQCRPESSHETRCFHGKSLLSIQPMQEAVENVDRKKRMCYTAKDVRLFADLEPRKEILF
ncbi:MAG: hypothetical protein IKM64_02515 [Clostridia bacterium]|nr:hypothetical protein [Clostridia bacterium]